MSDDLIRAVLELNARVESLEAENKALKDRFDDHKATFDELVAVMTEFIDRQDAKDKAPAIIVDADGVVTTAAEELAQRVDVFKSEITNSMDSLKRMFHQHLDDHQVNGARPAMLRGVELHNALKDL